ncbi:hypothetical protein [Microbacterium sp. 1P06AB]|uniref:hypothetical protein n=1 Tax=Microbacterium sp. 1P06AB TaxID=3132289 RepID=UPI0039A5C520
MIPITVHVRESRVEEFYVRFAEFITNVPDAADPARTASGTVPAWAVSESAEATAKKFMNEVSLPGLIVLRYLCDAAREETAYFRPQELADVMQHPKGASSIAGLLGGVGKAIRRADLPMYRTPNGGQWHYVWGWDGERYSMTPEVARLLRAAAPR